MSKSEIQGFQLARFEEPICEALDTYSRITDRQVTFGIDDDHRKVTRLELTPDKTYLARSSATAMHLGETIGSIVVIAFAPMDGTGERSKLFRLKDVNTRCFPRHTKVLPMPKTAFAEAHLTIVSAKVNEPECVLKLFAGSLNLLGIDYERDADDPRPKLVKSGDLGQSQYQFDQILTGHINGSPKATFTTGLRISRYLTPGKSGKRYGDLQAIYNPYNETLQVGAFLAITYEQAEKHANIFNLLKSEVPKLR